MWAWVMGTAESVMVSASDWEMASAAVSGSATVSECAKPPDSRRTTVRQS
jgi:hypothetical protein